MAMSSLTSIPPETIIDGKYRVLGEIGHGGMGRVYKAVHTTLGRMVAIKHLHANFADDEKVIKRFHLEAQLAASLGHDNICEVQDIGVASDNAPYLVMPLLSGVPFKDLIHEKLPLPRLVDILSQTLSALQTAHDGNIVHRDLKPDNIFITKVGDREDFVKLLDFGISKVMNQESVTELTKTGTLLGTPYYMSPEQVQGFKDIDHRADIYAMGVIAYEGLTGERPYTGESYGELLGKIIAKPFDPPRQLNPSIPVEIETVVLTAMAKHPDDRYGSADEMREAFQAALQNHERRSLPAMSSRSLTAETGSMAAGPISPPAASVPPVSTPPEQLVATSKRSNLLIGVVVLLGIAAALFVIWSHYGSGDVDERAAAPSAVETAPAPKPSEALPAAPPSPTAVTTPKAEPAAPPVEPEETPKPPSDVAAPSSLKSDAKRDLTLKARAPAKQTVESRPAKNTGSKTLKGRFRTEIDAEYPDN